MSYTAGSSLRAGAVIQVLEHLTNQYLGKKKIQLAKQNHSTELK
jgi:hypothetical protein